MSGFRTERSAWRLRVDSIDLFPRSCCIFNAIPLSRAAALHPRPEEKGLMSEFIHFEKVSYRYDSMSGLLLHAIHLSIAEGWTGIVGPNGAGKTTVLKLACGLLTPIAGCIRRPADAVYCEQRTDAMPEKFRLLLEEDTRAACEIRGRLEIQRDWPLRWDSLSHGERKRAQIATALWQQPAILALDEPTNHIDAEARNLLTGALRAYRGIGLLVSHDRQLLDALCGHCLFLDPPDAALRPGGYSAGKRESFREEAYARSQRDLARRQCARLQKEAQERASKAQQADRMRSKRALARGDSDGRERINRARVSGVDGHAGRLARLMQSRAEHAAQQLQTARIRKHYDLGIRIEGELCRRTTLLRLPAGTLSLGRNRTLAYPDLILHPADRIALTGANGTGKSTLIRAILTALALPAERLTYLPQEIDLAASRQILAEVRHQPKEMLGRIMTAVRRLGSRPAELLESSSPSPGELRKLLLGLGLARDPWLIIMDEPTNHLDLPSIECLEEALQECRCGLLLVSHDGAFLQKLAQTHWTIIRTPKGAVLQTDPGCATSNKGLEFEDCGVLRSTQRTEP